MDGRFIDPNPRFSEILGYSEAELRNITFAELTHPDDREVTIAAVRQLLAGEIPEYTLEKRYLRKDGSVVWSLTTVTLMKDAIGEPMRFIGVIEDITARKAAEAALREETRILELLNETGKLLASQLDLQGLVQAVTDAATELSGAEFGAFFYNTTGEDGDAFLLYTLSGAPREAFASFGQPRATAIFGPTFRGEAPIRLDDVTKDPRYGSMGPHHGMPRGHLPVRSYLAVPVASRSGEVIGGLFFGHSQTGVFSARAERLVAGVAAQAGIAIDNARMYEAAQRAAEERKVLLESERAARAAAERLSEVKDEFLATLSHELRTPLNAILGWAQVLRSGRKGEADYLKGLETIERNARIQTQLIEDLLDMSRVTAGNLRLDVQPTDPAAFIDAAIETVTPAAAAKGIRIEKELDRFGHADLGRPGAAPAGGLEPALERDQVHAGARPHSRGDDACGRPPGNHGDRRRHRHPPRFHSAPVRTLPAGGRVHDPPLWRARAGIVDRQEPRRAARRRGIRRQPRGGPGHDGHRGAPAVRRRGLVGTSVEDLEPSRQDAHLLTGR